MAVTQQQARSFGEDQADMPLPKNGVVILFADTCSHCQHSLQNTQKATATSNGTPVKWVDVDIKSGQETFLKLPGLKIAADKHGKSHYEIGGTKIEGVPTTVWMENGVATHVLKVGVLEAGDLDRLVAQQAALSPKQGQGSSIPNNKPPAPAAAVLH